MADTSCTLIVDSCSDLPSAAVQAKDVYLLNFPFVIEGAQLVDDMYQSITPHEFYEYMRNGANPSTMQITVQALLDVFSRAYEAGKPAVYLSFSSALSGSFDLACTIADRFLETHPDFELHVMDTHLASIAEGVLVLEAVHQHRKGLSASELADWAKEARFYVNELFMVDDLDALRRGGRIPSGVALAGAKLDVKPMLEIALDGSLSLSGMARGRKKGIKRLAQFFESHRVANETSKVVIAGADCPKDVDRLRSELLRIDDSLIIVESSIGPVIGSHVGPGMVAIAFLGVDARTELSLTDRIAQRVKSARQA